MGDEPDAYVDAAASGVGGGVEREVRFNRHDVLVGGRLAFIGIESTALLDGHPAMAVAVEDVGEWLDELRRRVHANLQPFQWRGSSVGL